MTTNNEQPTTTWYRVLHTTSPGRIDEVQVIKETGNWLTLTKGGRTQKSQSSHRFFPTLEEAQKYAEKILTERILRAQDDLTDAQTTLTNLAVPPVSGKQSPLDQAGAEVARLFAELKMTKNSAKATREGNKQRVAMLKPLLEEIWAAFAAKQTVNGIATKKEWAEQHAKTSLRNCEYILAGGNKNRPDSAKRFVSLDKVEGVIIGGVKYKLRTGEGAIGVLKGRKYATSIHLAVDEVIEPKKEDPQVLHARSNAKQLALCESNMPNLPREKGKLYATHVGAATCPRCRKFHDDYMRELHGEPAPVREVAAPSEPERREIERGMRHFNVEWREERGMDGLRLVKQDQKNWAVIDNSYVEERIIHRFKYKKEAQAEADRLTAAAKAATAQRGRKTPAADDLTFKELGERNHAALEKQTKKLAKKERRKTHAMADNGLTLCSRDADENTLLVEGDQEPTCANCSYEWGVQKELKMLKAKSEAVPASVTVVIDECPTPTRGKIRFGGFSGKTKTLDEMASPEALAAAGKLVEKLRETEEN